MGAGDVWPPGATRARPGAAPGCNATVPRSGSEFGTSLYATTAPPYLPPAPLEHDVRVTTVVVGAGFTGLSAALSLAERGQRVALLEAHEPGWGAAGRNGGQVNAGLKHEPDTVIRDLGPQFGPRLVWLSGVAPDALFELISRLGIGCEASRCGTLRVAHRSALEDSLRESVLQWQRRGTAVEFWDGPRLAEATGCERYSAGSFDPRGGSVNPLLLARGLAAAAQKAGCAVYCGTPALKLESLSGGWRITTPAGRVESESVVLATDGYSDNLWPGLRQSIVPIYGAIAATEPLPPDVAHTIVPGGQSVYESGAVTVYFRRDAHNRLLMGGRGPQRPATAKGDYAHLITYAETLWPALRGTRWTHGWNGQFALTPDFYPRLHMPAPGLFIGLGYSGRGVALGTAMGRELAAAALGAPCQSLALPVTAIPRIRFHRFWRVGVALGVAAARVHDRFAS